jgi:hypothetical protein
VIVLAGVVVAVLLLALVVLGLRQRGSTRGYLEWDPVARTAWRQDQESVDMAEMLALHNAARARDGLPPQTLAEYAEAVRRGASG